MIKVKIKTAETKDELNEEYRLRYEYLYKEGADPEYAIPEKKQYKDGFDSEKAKIIVAIEPLTNTIIGTIRLLFKTETNFPYEWCYDYKYISDYLKNVKEQIYHRCALLDRTCIHSGFRGQGLYWAMVDHLELLMKENNSDILFSTWIASNYQLALSHVRKSNWVLPQKEYFNSKGKPYYFGFKILKPH